MPFRIVGDLVTNQSLHDVKTAETGKERVISVHDASIVDMNGDGYPDILYSPSSGGWYWWKNLGNNQFANRASFLNPPVSTPAVSLDSPLTSGDTSATTLADMDSDGLIDIVQYLRTGWAYGSGDINLHSWDIVATWDIKWWRNLGNGQLMSTPRIVSGLKTHTTYPDASGGCSIATLYCGPSIQTGSEISLADMNGDGLADFVYSSLYMGSGDLKTAVFSYQPNQGANGFGARVIVNSVNNVPFTIYNGIQTGTKLLEYHRFVDVNGDGLTDILIAEAGSYRYYPLRADGLYAASISLTGSPAQNLSRDNYLALTDSNGDGFVDILQGTASTYFNYWLDMSGNHQLVESISTPLGGSTGFHYSRLRSRNTNRWVPSDVTAFDGLGGSIRSDYVFVDGKYVGWPNNEFRGYGMAYEYRSDTAIKLVQFGQGDDTKGKILSTVEGSQFPSPSPFDASTTYTYVPTTPMPPGVSRLDLTNKRVQGYQSNGVVSKKDTAYSDYDFYGNPRRITVSGDGVRSRVSTNDFIYNTSAYIVNRQSHTATRVDSVTGTKIDESWFDYDGLPNGTAPTKGDVTKETRWYSAGVNPVVQHVYDSVGNRVGTIDAKNNTCVATGGLTSKVVFDTSFQTYPIIETNALCLVSTKSYWGVNNGILSTALVAGSYSVPGQLASVIDPNQVRTDSYWDALSRARAIVAQPDAAAAPTTQWSYGVTGIAPNSTRRLAREVLGGSTLETVTYTDGLGRVIQSKSEAEQAGQWVTQDTAYNARGWVSSVNVPYLTATSAYTARKTSQPKSSTQYDDVGRPTIVTNPDGTSRSMTYSAWEIPNIQVTTTDERSYVTTRTYDAFGRLAKVVEPVGGGTATYNYEEFDSSGRNTQKILDAAGNLTYSIYNTLGRKDTDYDQDRLVTTYGFDANGNVTSRMDTKGQFLSYSYDKLNRVANKLYPTGATTNYFYDDTAAGKYRVGRLWRVTDSTGSTVISYDARGHVAQSDKTIGTATYVLKTTYDSMDRIATMTYPDNEVVQNSYNAQGLLDKVRSVTYSQDYISNIDYSTLGKVTLRAAGNGKVTSYDYYDTIAKGATSFRLRNLSTPGLQNFTYSYDNSGNVLNIADPIRSGNQYFIYDALGRLTSGSTVSPPIYNYAHSYSYSPIGNMLTGEGKTFSYGWQPHTPISDGTCSYGYDVVGNMSTSNCAGVVRTFTWDADQHLTSVYNTTQNYGQYSYDFSGVRVKKIEGTTTTLIPFSQYRTANGITTKYYYANGERVAERTGPAATDVYYYHGEHLGSSNIVSNSAGAEVKGIFYRPFGRTLNESGSKTVAYKYTGQELDANTGLYYYGGRYYDPNLMHFISADSVIPDTTDPQSLNRYSYVRNNPIKRVDPDGKTDVIYSAGGLSANNPILANTNLPGWNYYIADAYGATYPMGAGPLERTAWQGRPFDNVFGSDQVSMIRDSLSDYIQDQRLFSTIGTPMLYEVWKQSREGLPWDTKHFLSPDSVYIVNGKAELRDYLGNKIWGTAMNEMGLPLWKALVGALVQGALSPQGEDPRDQEGIASGYSQDYVYGPLSDQTFFDGDEEYYYDYE